MYYQILLIVLKVKQNEFDPGSGFETFVVGSFFPFPVRLEDFLFGWKCLFYNFRTKRSKLLIDCSLCEWRLQIDS